MSTNSGNRDRTFHVDIEQRLRDALGQGGERTGTRDLHHGSGPDAPQLGDGEIREAQMHQWQVNDRWERSLVDLKVEQVALRAALLGRIEDRAQFTIGVERMQEALADALARAERTLHAAEQARSAHPAPGTSPDPVEGLPRRMDETERRLSAIEARLAATLSGLPRLQEDHDRLLALAGSGTLRGRVVRWLLQGHAAQR